MPASQSLIVEIERAFNRGAGSHCSDVLRRVTDLFLLGTESLADEHVVIFDDVMSYLIEKVQREALIELSGRLAPVSKAPIKVIGQLSRDDDIRVAGPVLEKSQVLTDADLVEIATTKSQSHLSAIAGRTQISEPVTDILIERGDSTVTQKVTANGGARFSQLGFSKVASRAERDEELAAAVAKRRDLPPELFERLVLRATEIVRRRLLASAAPDMQERIKEVLSVVSRKVARLEAARIRAMGAAKLMPKDPYRLKKRILTYAKDGQTAEMFETLAAFCGVPVKAVKNIVRQGAVEGMLVLGKASGLGWQELLEVLNAVMPGATDAPHKVQLLFQEFVMLSGSNAQRVIRFIKANQAVSKDVIRKMM